jgi:hypothetical protein
MKYIITEDQYSKFIKVEPHVVKTVQKYLDVLIKTSKRVVQSKATNYGNICENYCKNNKVFLDVTYYFDSEESDGSGGEFVEGIINISKEIVKEIIETFKLRKTATLNLIVDWYVENYLDRIRIESGENDLDINDIEFVDVSMSCPEDVDVSNLTRKEMLDYIYRNTHNREGEHDNLNDEDLKDLYTFTRHSVQRKQDLGF